ncbi:MAG: 2-isopropylmalate synthase [Deltaproteobacteria bacterium]|nr:2-isopropylmalate synthase [Deltaproteobacteria bacterium]
MSERIIIFDTTLRDGEQSPGASMNAGEKLHLALQLEKLGVDVIEAGFPAASEGDFEAVRSIAQKVRHTRIAGLARASKEDIDRAWGAIKEAAHPRIHTFLASSDIHLKYKLKMTREEVINRTVESVRYARSLTDDVEFSTEDGSRSDWDYICRVFEAAIEAGATTINLPDTVGYALPDEFGQMVKYVKDHVPNIHRAVISVHCHNDLGLATANTLAGINAGARQAEVTINGNGERAGNTSLEEIVMALHTRRQYLHLETGIVTQEIYPSSRLVRMITGIPVQPNKAIVGANAFAHEAGIHQDGMLKNPMTYEIMDPEAIGLLHSSLVLGKHSGRHAFKDRLEKMGHSLPEEEINRLFVRFKELADKKKEIVEEDLESMLADELFRTPEIIRLEYLNVISGTVAVPTATVILSIDGEKKQSAGFGVGPIDATYNTIAKMVGTTSRLGRFSVSAITGGMDAQGEVTVRLEENGWTVMGRGTDPDIITAAAKAYVDGLNRLEYRKKHPKLSEHL